MVISSSFLMMIFSLILVALVGYRVSRWMDEEFAEKWFLDGGALKISYRFKNVYMDICATLVVLENVISSYVLPLEKITVWDLVVTLLIYIVYRGYGFTYKKKDSKI